MEKRKNMKTYYIGWIVHDILMNKLKSNTYFKMYISTSSEVFLNRIPSSRVSWYLDMSFGNDFFFKKTKKCKYTDIFDRYFRFFSEISPRSIGKMAFQHWFFNIPSSKFIVPDFENMSI